MEIQKNIGWVDKPIKFLTPHMPMEDDSSSREAPPAGKWNPDQAELMRQNFMVTETTNGDLKNLSEILSQKADKRVSQSAIIRALVHLAAHDPTSIPKILKYVSHEQIKPGRK